MSVSSELDELTNTFTFDQKFCNQLFSSTNAEQATELLVSQLWANNSFLLCLKSLIHDKAIINFEKTSRDKAQVWTLILSESFIRDMGLILYLCIRGIPLEANVALRRAFENLGVLTHIWQYPPKLDFVDKPNNSKEYADAFKRYGSNENKIADIHKRFSAMKIPKVATMLYKLTSNFAVHGGTGNRLATSTIENTSLACKLYNRPEIESQNLKQQLEIITQGHQLLCAEYMNLCVNYGFQSDELKQVAQFLIAMLPINGQRTPLMQEEINIWLQKLSN